MLPSAQIHRSPGAGLDATDRGHRCPAPPGLQHRSLLWRDGEAQLVVVATSDCQGSAPVRVIQCTERRRQGQALQVHRGTASALGQEMSEIGRQAVGDIDPAGGQAPHGRALRPPLVWGGAGASPGRRRVGMVDRTGRRAALTEGTGDEDLIPRTRAAPPQAQSRRGEPIDADRDGEWAAIKLPPTNATTWGLPGSRCPRGS